MPYVTWLAAGEGTAFPVRLKTRLRAWWEGYDLSVLKPAAEAPPGAEIVGEVGTYIAPDASGEPVGNNGRPLWNADRVKVAETLWGNDFTSPGGIEHTMYLIKPLGIDPKMSILDMSAGLGGVARTIAKEYKAWVNGMEASPLMAGIAQERSLKEGMAKQAPIELYDPTHLELTKRYDGIFAKEAFFTVPDKDKLFDNITKAIKPGGQFLFTDYCVGPNTDPANPHLATWASREPVPPALWPVDRVVKALKTRKLDVRTNEDITELQKQLILTALNNFLIHLEAHKMDQATKIAVLDEIELWARRVMAFDHGLRVYRFYCMRH